MTLPVAGNPPAIAYVPQNQLSAIGKGAVQALTWLATVYINCALSSNFSLTLGGATTLVFVNPQPGQEVLVWIKQDGTGSRTPTFKAPDGSTGVLYAGGSAPSWTTTASATDVAIFRYNDILGNFVGASVALAIS